MGEKPGLPMISLSPQEKVKGKNSAVPVLPGSWKSYSPLLSVTVTVSLVHKKLLQISTERLNNQWNHVRSSLRSFSTSKSTTVIPCHIGSYYARLLAQTNWCYIISLVHCQCLCCRLKQYQKLVFAYTKPSKRTDFSGTEVVFTNFGNFLLRDGFHFSLHLDGDPTQTLDLFLSLCCYPHPHPPFFFLILIFRIITRWFSRAFLYLQYFISDKASSICPCKSSVSYF